VTFPRVLAYERRQTDVADAITNAIGNPLPRRRPEEHEFEQRKQFSVATG